MQMNAREPRLSWGSRFIHFSNVVIKSSSPPTLSSVVKESSSAIVHIHWHMERNKSKDRSDHYAT